MREILDVRWHVAPLKTPRIWLHCSRCTTRTPFVCGEKFRINAQKRRLDAWLVYRCAQCDQTWNCPVLERCRVADVAPAMLQAMTSNDAVLARQYAFDVSRLKRHSERIEEFAEVVVGKSLTGERVDLPRQVVISVAMPVPCHVRLDRLLAIELRLSRATVRQLHDAAVLAVRPRSRAALRRGLRDGQVVAVDLALLDAFPDLLAAIIGGVL